MAIPAATTARPGDPSLERTELLLKPGDRLTRAEFERRYARMPHVKKAELIEGVVYMPSPVRARKHGSPQLRLAAWLGAYRRNGVLEYLAWITSENRIVRWQLRDGEYREIEPAAEGLFHSGIFPGLWLEATALLRGDMRSVLAALRRGIDSSEHASFFAD